MGRRTTILALEQIREINMTPLIDLTFLLLITFIITFPLIEQSVPVNLPRGAAEDIDSSRARVITVDLKGANLSRPAAYREKRPGRGDEGAG